jgi:hypothetical protein
MSFTPIKVGDSTSTVKTGLTRDELIDRAIAELQQLKQTVDALGGSTIAGVLAVSANDIVTSIDIHAKSHLHPVAVKGGAAGYQDAVGLAASLGGIPDNTSGEDGMFAFGDDGHIYFRTGGAWALVI